MSRLPRWDVLRRLECEAQGCGGLGFCWVRIADCDECARDALRQIRRQQPDDARANDEHAVAGRQSQRPSGH